MVAWNDEDRNPRTSEFKQVGVNHIDNLLGDAGTEEQVAPMDDEVRTGLPGVVEHALEVGEEVRTAAALLESRPDGVVETKVGVGEEQDADHG